MFDALRLYRGHLRLGDLPAALADRYGSRGAIEAAHRSWTYESLATEVAERARDHAGLAGQTVLLRWPNEPELLVELFALCRAGAVVAPVKLRAPLSEIAAIAAATAATAAIAPAGTELPELSPTLQRAAAGQTAVFLCTSGTTGRPKAAALTHHGLLSAMAPLLALPFGRATGPRRHRDAVQSALPLTHVMGLVTALGALVAGVSWVHRARFVAGEQLDLLESRRANVFVGVPTMYADLEAAGAAERDLRFVQLWVSGADTMPTDRARRFQKRGAAIVLGGQPVGRAWFADSYGMVELSGAAAVRVLPPAEVRVPYVVRAGLRVRTVDPEGRPLAPGRHGQLQFKGSGVMAGYRGREGGLQDGWLSTGDHGRALLGGLFFVSGRSRDRLKVGGFSVFPAEVEAVLDAYPEVRELMVVGVPDARLGDRLVALAVAGPEFDADAFLAWSTTQLAGHRRPAAVLEVGELPRGAHGKLDRDAATRIAIERTRHGVSFG